MADIELWIQLENRPWDACPKNIDRMTGRVIENIPNMAPPINVTLKSPETGAIRDVKMFLPVNEGQENGEWHVKDALILRRYKRPENEDQSDAWTIPDDRKVNPWDLNEPDPTDEGTMGTIPGPTIECNVGDKVIVHFRNKDFRKKGKDQTITIPLPFPPFQITFTLPAPPLPVEERAHSLHPHGIVFSPRYDGAYPLSPPDPTQPVGPEATLWSQLGVSGFKKGDRVPPGGTFTYTWDTFGWPTTAGVWHYHDHSICDAENVLLGALGFLVIHNPADEDDVIGQDLPGNSPNGPLIETKCFPFPFAVPVLPHDLEGLGDLQPIAALRGGRAVTPEAAIGRKKVDQKYEGDSEEPKLARDFAVRRGDLVLELDRELTLVARLCLPFYVPPPGRAQYLQYYHELPGVGMTINGRRFLGNTPTLIAGVATKMRFGLAAMNSATFHTFHLHGHRWVIPGPSGTTPAEIQVSPQNSAVSQFEDTKIFGPANSFSLTVNQGSFMGSLFTPDPSRAPGVGEWHMHCHLLSHMMPGGMMGSLLVIKGGELALFLPRGVPCPGMEPEAPPPEEEAPMTATVRGVGSCAWQDDVSGTPETTIKVGGTVTWTDEGCSPHTVVSDNVAPFDNLAPPLNLAVLPANRTFNTVGDYGYHCGVHGGDPVSKTNMWGIVHVVP